MSDHITKTEFYAALAALGDALAAPSELERRARLNEVVGAFKISGMPSAALSKAVEAPMHEPNEKPVLRKGPSDGELLVSREIVAVEVPIDAIAWGSSDSGASASATHVPFSAKLRRRGPGDVLFEAFIGGRSVASIPWDNLVKTCVRLDPDHASEAQRQVTDARRQMGEAQAAMYGKEAQIVQLKQQLGAAHKRIEELSGAFTYSRTPPQKCPGGCSRGGEGPACGLPGCAG